MLRASLRMEFQKIIDEEWISVNMRVGRQENYIPNTEQDENRPTVGNILLTIDLFNIYIYNIYTWIWTAPWLAGTRPEQRLLVTAVWKGKRAPCRSNCKLSLDWHKGGLGTYIFNRSGNRHKSGEVGCLQYECTVYCSIQHSRYIYIYMLYAIYSFTEGHPKGSRRVNLHGEIMRSGVEQFTEVPLQVWAVRPHSHHEAMLHQPAMTFTFYIFALGVLSHLIY